MMFSEPWFMLLFVGTVLAFFLVPVRRREAVLILSGGLFYAVAAGPWLLLIVGLVLMTYAASGRLGVWLNSVALLGLLASFKLRGVGTVFSGAVPAAGQLVFPLGLSFLAFELIHVAVERQRGKIPRLTLSSLAAFALYFPCRVAGPIKRYQPFITSLHEARWSIEQCYRGVVRILWGAVKKVVVADVLALIIAELNFPTTRLQTWKGIVAYSCYLFLDFSAYSDIAIGMSWVLGLRVPENFRLPYLSRNIREFWTRWHISLSSWLGDYLYLPLGKRFVAAPARLPPRDAAVLSYLVTFSLCGIWHGFSLNFLLWGLYHGMLLAAYALYVSSRDLKGRPRSRRGGVVGGIVSLASSAVTFFLVTVGWVLFAFPVPKAVDLYRRLLGGQG